MRKAPFLLAAGFFSALIGLAGCGGSGDAEDTKRKALSAQAPDGYSTVVQYLYVSYYGRPADPAGLNFWASYLAAGGAPTDLPSFLSAYSSNAAVRVVIDNFGKSAESVALYGTDNTSIVRAIYGNLFNRDPDAEGLKFYVDGLNAGLITTAQAAAMIANGAQGSDQSSVANKVSVAVQFTNQVAGSTEGSTYDGQESNQIVRSALSKVTAASDLSTSANALFNSMLAPRMTVRWPKAAVGGWVMLDPSRSTDPSGKALTFDWKVVKAPEGWNGFGYSDSKGRVGFSNNGRGGTQVWGTFVFSVSASNGTRRSDDLIVELEVCCDGKDPIQKASEFTAKLPTYTVAQARAIWAEERPTNVDEMFRVAGIYGFSLAHIEFLAGMTPGTLINLAIEGTGFNASQPSGGAHIIGYTQPFDRVIQIDADPAKVNYPDDFAATRSRQALVEDPFCSQGASTLTLRSEDLGDLALPKIEAVPLPSAILRMATIKDIFSLMNPNIGNGCVKDMRKAWRLTLDRLVKLNVNAITITPWSYFDARSTAWTIPLAGTINGSGMSDESIATVVSEARARNIKVYWINQLQFVVRPDGSYLPQDQTTTADVEKALSALEGYLSERAATLQSLGVDGMVLGSWYWVNFGSHLSPQRFSEANVSLINKIKEKFRGQILYGPGSNSDLTPALNSAVDAYVYIPGLNFDWSKSAVYSVPALLAQFESNYSAFKEAAGSKPLIFDLGIQSRRGYLTDSPGYYDPFCTNRGTDPCIQRKLSGDYATQAIYSEAGFQFMAKTRGLNLGGVMMSYFIDDNLLPPVNFFNIDASVRGKPAESIFYRWFTAK